MSLVLCNNSKWSIEGEKDFWTGGPRGLRASHSDIEIQEPGSELVVKSETQMDDEWPIRAVRV